MKFVQSNSSKQGSTEVDNLVVKLAAYSKFMTLSNIKLNNMQITIHDKEYKYKQI